MRRTRRNRRRRGKRTPWKRPPGRTFPSKRTGTHICTERCITRPAATASSGGKSCPPGLVGLTRGALEKEIGGLYENAAVTGFSAAEVDVSTRMDVPCPLHWVLRAGDDGLLAVLQNTTGETLTVVRRTDIPVALVAGEEQDELRDGRMFDDVQALEGYLESLSS